MRSIICNAQSIQGILDESKTATRRVIVPQPDLLYRLTDDIIEVVHTQKEMEGFYVNKIEQWRNIKINTDISEQRLYGRLGWSYLLKNEIQGVWSEGLRGLVSIKRAQHRKRIFDGILIPQQQENISFSSQIDLHGISWDAQSINIANKTFRWEPRQQQTRELKVGNTERKLARSKGTRERDRRRKTSNVEINQQRERAHSLGSEKRAVQSKTRSTNAKHESACNFKYMPYRKGLNLWVRESFCKFGYNSFEWILNTQNWIYKASATDWDLEMLKINNRKWTSPLFMPRIASRITLKIEDVQVERIQDITDKGIISEGITKSELYNLGYLPGNLRELHRPRNDNGDFLYGLYGTFAKLWDSINLKRGYGWDTNSWVWVISFSLDSVGRYVE
ncbi:hypothetical protein LCGC14_0642240 [marine sediment metagenome]|uniref:Uncharacterized protein n=1 Tax=marine sediment metagenome TaxID=412755 RepID=A0A0F9RID1_9ZZZZ